MIKDPKFDDIRPFYDEEIPAAMERIASNNSFPLVASFVFPDLDLEAAKERVRSYKNIAEFQYDAMYEANKRIIANSIKEFTFSGIESLDTNTKYLFVGNHRDIMLDSCLMQYVLYCNGHVPSEITFGANLMQGDIVINIGKSNKMFRVERPGNSPREFYKASVHLSEYIRHALTEKHESVWIAQRNGRTKDGIDRTDQGIIKMFGMSRSDDKIEALAELNIVPVSVSYEWESCDLLKTLELYETRKGPYTKKPGEDLNSILTGVMQQKGRVHMHFCQPITREDLMPYDNLTAGDFNRQVASIIDQRICTTYKLWPNNYIAHDILYRKNEYKDRYTEEEKQAFQQRMMSLAKYDETCNMDTLSEIFLGIYANPIESAKLFAVNS